MTSRGNNNARPEYLRNPDGSLRRDQFGRPIRMRPASTHSSTGPKNTSTTSKQVFPPKRPPVEETQILSPDSEEIQYPAQQYSGRPTSGQQYPGGRPAGQQYPGRRTPAQPYPSRPYGSESQPPRQYIPRRPQELGDDYAPYHAGEDNARYYEQTRYDARPSRNERMQTARPDPRPARPIRSARPDHRSPRPELHATRERQHRRGGRRPGCMRALGVALIIVLVLLGLGTVWADARLNRVDAMPEEHIGNTAGTNWLLVGSDSRAGLSDAEIEKYGTGGDLGGSGRTDTIMLLHIPTAGQAQLISIPRDSYVSIQDYGMDKINAAYSYGGSQLLTHTVENATGLRIDHYAEIGMGGLAKLVDLVDGIHMCPDEPMDDPNANISIDAGCQTFDGATALGYVRSRASGMGDLDRVKHQREFFAALMNRVTSPRTLANPGDIMPLISHASGTFTVDNHDHVWDLARVAWAMRSGVSTETVPISGFQDTDVGSVVLWDEMAAEELFAAIR